ncbi:MAG: hypothetical protein NC433_03850 [Clostridiales bacterium]|nr:hypothetical protein [Clostridiales bacterium]
MQENKGKVIGLIRIIVFSIILLMFMGALIVEFVDIMKIRNILSKILFIVCFLLIIILAKQPKIAAPRIIILDCLSVAMFIGLMVYLGRGHAEANEILNTFKGNNLYVCYYGEGVGDNGYSDLESALGDDIENRKISGNYSKFEEIYRIQVGDRFFVYFKTTDDITESIIEVEFFRQDDLFYKSGSKALSYDGVISHEGYTVEETIRTDIVNTMWRGVGRQEAASPAWGVSDDERIFSMSVNSKQIDDAILIDEIDGKKYYFWIITDVDEIKTIDDVKAAEIEMSSNDEKSD